MAENTPVDLIRIPNGTYVGTGQGANAPVTVEMKVGFGKIESVKILASREPIYVYDAVLPLLPGRATTRIPESNPFVFRKDQSYRGLQEAIDAAIVPQLDGYPAPGFLSRTTFFLTSNQPGKIALNALMILFIVLVIVDFSVGPVLNPGTGQSLNCYNCQACVGVCPVKKRRRPAVSDGDGHRDAPGALRKRRAACEILRRLRSVRGQVPGGEFRPVDRIGGHRTAQAPAAA